MSKARLFGLVAAIALAFAAGALLQTWHARELMKAHPCTVTYWNPTDKAFMHMPLDDRACLKLGSTREYSGTWIDDVYGSFVPDRPQGLPQALALNLQWPKRLQVYRLAGMTWPSERASGQKFHVVVRGRFGTRDCCWADVPRNKIVVDEVVSARLETGG